jgi:hypothetical protein
MNDRAGLKNALDIEEGFSVDYSPQSKGDPDGQG